MLIVEGADLVGKSTFIERLCEHERMQAYGMLPIHLGPLPNGWDPVWSYVEHASLNGVHDRFHMSELVYGSVLRGGPIMTAWQYGFLDTLLYLTRSMITVVITAEDHLIRQRWTQRELYSADDLVKVNNTFCAIATGHQLGLYKPILPIRIHCTDASPYPLQKDINHVVERYDVERSARLELARSPKALRVLGLHV